MRRLAIATLLLVSGIAPVVRAQDSQPGQVDPLAPPAPDGRTPDRHSPEPPMAEPVDGPGGDASLRRELDELRRRLDAIEGGGAGPQEPVAGPQLWSYIKENIRLSVTLNTFFVYREHSLVSANGPTGDASAFTVGQFELDIWSEHRIGLDFRVDIDMVEDDGGSIGGNGAFNYAEDLQVEQAYVQADFGKLLAGGPPVRLMFGRFNAPIGFEPIDAPGLWQFSRSNLAVLLTPGNLVGARGQVYTSFLDFDAYIANGWNTNDDPDREKTGGGRLTLKLGGDPGAPLLQLAPAVIFGHEPTAERAGDLRVVADVVAIIRPMDRVQLGLEANFGHESNPIERNPVNGAGPIRVGDHATWNAYLASLNVRLTPWFAVTMRGEYIHDEDGFHTQLVRLTGRTGQHHLKSGTVALLFKVPTGDGGVFDPLFINLEYRYDKSDQKIYTSHSPSDVGDATHASQLAFQVFFYF
jgi:hypothetical protein